MDTLLLPGMDGTGTLFGSFARLLDPRLNPRVVSFPVDTPLSYEELLQTIEVPVGPFAIVAESFSGPLGVRLANKYPNQVRGLILVATFVRSPSPLVSWMSLVGSALFHLKPPEIAIRWALLGFDANTDEIAAVRSALETVHPRVLANRLREIARVDAAQDLASSVAPLLYIAGAADRLVGIGAMEKMKTIRTDVETRILDAPHLVLQRRSAEAAELVSQFLLPKCS